MDRLCHLLLTPTPTQESSPVRFDWDCPEAQGLSLCFLVATETASSGQDIGFLDIPDMPIDGGVGGRRQRLWMSNAGNDIGMSLIMDLKRRTPKFGHELDAFWSGHSVQFIPSSAETITNDLFSHIRVAVAEEQPRKKVRLAPKEIDKRLYGSPWHWEILWTVGNETLNGILKDNVGQPRWENSRFSEQRRELIFEWSSNPSDDISPANIPVPSRIVLKRDDGDMKLAEIDVYGRGMGKDQGYSMRATKFLQASIGLLVAAGYLESSTGNYDVGRETSSAKLNQQMNLADCEISLFDYSANADTHKEVFPISGGFPARSVIRWNRNYFNECDYRFCFTGDVMSKSESNTGIIVRRGGDFGGGQFSLRPGFHWLPYAEVLVDGNTMGVGSGEVLEGGPIRVRMIRNEPVPGELIHILDAHFRGSALPRKQGARQRTPISTEMMTKLTDDEETTVRRMLRLVESAKAQCEINSNGKPKSLTWADLEKYLNIPLDEIESPKGGSYTIGPIGDDVRYGYPDGNPINVE